MIISTAAPEACHLTDPHLTCQFAGICVSMELLEVALKQSIAWSLSRPEVGRLADSAAKSPARRLNIADDLLECVESAHLEAQRESQVRAFVSRFKIELDQLMGQLAGPANEERDHTPGGQAAGALDLETAPAGARTTEQQVASGASLDSSARPPEQQQQHQRPRRPTEPTIKMDGKYSGVYNINGAQTTDEDEEDEEDFDEAYLRHLELVYGVLGGEQARRPSAPQRAHRPRRGAAMAEGPHQEDDGYRSLSRDSSTTNSADKRRPTGGPERPSLGLLQQLNDIKSRVIDLVRELDEVARDKLDEEELAAYRRRRDALVHKLDSLLSGQAEARFRSSGDGRDQSHAHGSADSSQSSSSDGYEEQTQVIDYDFNRRASDLNEIRRQASPTRRNDVAGGAQTTLPLIDGSQHASTQIDVTSTSSAGRPGKLFAEQPNDFKVITCDFERRSRQTNEPEMNGHHLPSTSSSSSGSHSSATTSSFI